MKKKFATIFNNFENVHLTKDVGMIPCAFTMLEGYDKSIIFYWDKKGKEEKIELNEVILHPIKARFRLFYYLKLFIEILLENVTAINLYHDSIQTALFCYVAKLINVKVYLKLDLGDRGCEALLKRKYSKNFIDKMRLVGLNLATCISTETLWIFDNLNKNNVFKSDRFLQIPNAILESTVKSEPKPYCQRFNRIVVVGRVGAFEKNHELILNALTEIKMLNGWTIDFVGPIEESFNEKIDLFYKNNESYINIVRFLGNKNRDELMDIYSTSKVFLLSSLWEGFSLAMVEAAYLGCYIISTKVGGVLEVTDNGSLGNIYEKEELAEKLMQLDDSVVGAGYDKRLTFCQDTFQLGKYSKNIAKRLG
ncbi:glycosyltransferase family 4 protein [Shewanella baltica]|uniref:glycosyltransferase family 4 protein n=1 Tax=Shewanella baltica TaxID=62322 RepID=UPI00217ECF41|nr:glycosyltransferase family 4 protein [Shewanella baltica]MCS6124082.1 glycosyltransferase family 4 protein [Shewanella baltica]